MRPRRRRIEDGRNNSIQWQIALCCSFQIPTGHGALRCLIPVAFRGGGSSQNIPKDDPGEFATPPTNAAAKKSLKNGSTNNIMRLPIGNNAVKKGGLVTATPKTFKENPIKANVPVIREVSVTPLAYRRFDSSG